MALIPDEYVWTAGRVVDEPTLELQEEGHHPVVRFLLSVDCKDGSTLQRQIEARGATARYLQQKMVKKGDFVVAAGIVRTEEEPDSQPYLLLRVVSVDTSEDL